MSFVSIPEHHERCDRVSTDAGCYWCCSACNYDRHQCPGCGDPLTHLENNRDGTPHGDCISEPEPVWAGFRILVTGSRDWSDALQIGNVLAEYHRTDIGPCTSPRCSKPQPHASHGATGCAALAESAGIPVRRFYDASVTPPAEGQS